MHWWQRIASFDVAARRFLAGAFLIELGHAFLWTLQNLYVRAVGFREAEAGQVLSMNTIGIVLATFPAAYMYDRLGPRRSLSLACVAATVGMVGMACSTALPVLKAFAVLNGAAFCLHNVVAAPFIMSIARPHERSHLFGAEFASHTSAQTVGPLLAGWLAAHSLVGWLPGADAAGLDAAQLLRGALIVGTERRTLFGILRKDRRALWVKLAIPNCIIGIGAGLTIPFINLYLTDRFALDTDALGLVMAAAAATMTVAVLAVPAVVARWGFVRATITSELLSLPFFALLAFTTDVRVAVVAVIIRQALMNVCHPIWRNFMMEITPPLWRASVNSITMLAWNAGWGFSVVAGGLLIEGTAGLLGTGTDGYAVPIVLTIALYLAALGFEAWFFWGRRGLGVATTGETLSAPHEGQID